MSEMDINATVAAAKARVIMTAVVTECQLAKQAVEILANVSVAVDQLLLAAPTPADVTSEILSLTGNLSSMDTKVPHLVASVVQEIATLLSQPVMLAVDTPFQVGGVTTTKKQLLLLAASAI